MKLLTALLCLFALPAYGQHATGFLGFKDGPKRYWKMSQLEAEKLPDHFDSRELGVVAPIKDQGSCGSCWAFSMTKTFESARLSAGESYLDLAEQDLVLNDKEMSGCSGGYMDAHYIVEHGLALEKDCPYTARDSGKCDTKNPAAKSYGWAFVGEAGRAPTEEELKAAIVRFHVVSVTVAAGGADWGGGNGGKMTECYNRGTNHMINLVGYDCTPKEPKGWRWPWPRPRPPKPVPTSGCTFILANSWGTDWGDKGFGYAKQGCDALASETDSALVIDSELGPPQFE